VNEYIIGASLDSEAAKDDTFKRQDPFNKEWKELKSYAGIEKNFKRRIDRQLSKSYDYAVANSVDTNSPAYLDSAYAVSSGLDGANSKEINPGDVFRNGYGLFDVITPPWNLYELANYYDTSFANHAAIDAKVENIVGLGYDFNVAKSALFKMESMMNTEQRDRARNRIERTKIELVRY
jgi:hypothetical protein